MGKETSVKSAVQKRQERLVIWGAAGVIVASVVTTLYVTGAFSGLSQGGAQGYNNVTFTDAVITCTEQTRSEYKGVLHGLTLDDHSSRFDEPENTYKVFFNAQMASKKSSTGVSDFFINCYVDGSRGAVAEYVVYEDKEAATQAIRKNTGGLFGWPLHK